MIIILIYILDCSCYCSKGLKLHIDVVLWAVSGLGGGSLEHYRWKPNENSVFVVGVISFVDLHPIRLVKMLEHLWWSFHFNLLVDDSRGKSKNTEKALALEDCFRSLLEREREKERERERENAIL